MVVATTTDASDDAVRLLCQSAATPAIRGSPHDVLDRYYQAARLYQADIIVRITADCPVIDPDVIDKTVNAFLSMPQIQSGQRRINPELLICNFYRTCFAANRLPPPWGRTLPHRPGCGSVRLRGLELAWREATLPHQREHVMPFFYEQPERFHILLVDHAVKISARCAGRWTPLKTWSCCERCMPILRVATIFPGWKCWIFSSAIRS